MKPLLVILSVAKNLFPGGPQFWKKILRYAQNHVYARVILGVALSVFLSSVEAEQLTLRKGNGPEVETLDPHKARSVVAANVLRDLYEGLVGEAPDGTLRPGAASHWEISADGRIYTFHLRDAARWSNGDPVRAEDFVAGLRRCIDPKTAASYAQALSPIINAAAILAGRAPVATLAVEAITPLRLRITLEHPTPYFIGLLTHPSTYPIHRPSLARYGDQFARPGALVSNGAYRLHEWQLQSHILLQRNPQYWNNAATRIAQVRYVTTEDINAELKRYRAGELDWTETVPASQAQWIRANLPGELHTEPYLGVYYYGLNMTRPPFKDQPMLRRALALAIDRQVITDKVLGTGERPASGWVPPGTAGYAQQTPAWAAWPRERRLAEARRLYAAAGYSPQHPLRIEIRYNTHEDHKKIALVVAAMWKQFLGVETTLLNEELKTFFQSRRQRVLTQVFRATWIGDYNDPQSFLGVLQSASGLNDTGYASPAYDAILASAANESDPAHRSALLVNAERQLLDDLPVIPLYFYVSKRLVKPNIVGWQGNIMDHHYTKDMQIFAEN